MVECKGADCKKWTKAQQEALSRCESIFDAAFEMGLFELNCLKDCPYKDEEDK